MDPQTPTPPADCDCGLHPSAFYLFATLLLTSCATAMLCAAMMTQQWERVSWERAALQALANASDTALLWLLDDKVVKVVLPRASMAVKVQRKLYERCYALPPQKIEHTSSRKGGDTFLVPMNGGIWTMCVSLEEEEVTILSRAGFPTGPLCTNYLASNEDEESRADWQHRMQNLSISCALVCLIVLGSAALVGAFGVCRHQISAVLVTGVMYLLAGLFATFTLLIMHWKRVQREWTGAVGAVGGRAEGVVGGAGAGMGGNTLNSLLAARRFGTAWSPDLAWGGVALAATASLLWILLSKIMRYNPITSMLL